MVDLIYYRLGAFYRKRLGFKDKFFGYAALGDRAFKAALYIDRLAAVFYNRKVYRIGVFAHDAYLVFIDIARKNEFIRPRHVVGLGYIADIDDRLHIRSLELRYHAAISLDNDADGICADIGYG